MRNTNTSTDLRVIQDLLATDQVQRINQFRVSMGVMFWVPSVLMSVILGGYIAYIYGNPAPGLSASAIAFCLSGFGWFARFYYSGRRASGLINVLHGNVPWDSLRTYAASTQELSRINTLEGFMARDAYPARSMNVMPMLMALVVIMEAIVHRNAADIS